MTSEIRGKPAYRPLLDRRISARRRGISAQYFRVRADLRGKLPELVAPAFLARLKAFRISLISVAMLRPPTKHHCRMAELKSFVPSMRMHERQCELISMRCASPSSPFRPRLNGSSRLSVDHFKQSSMTRILGPEAFNLFSSTPANARQKATYARV